MLISMTIEQKPNLYAILPAKVRYAKDLTAAEKLLFAEITALSTSQGYCSATNSYIGHLLGLSERSVSRQVAKLVEGGYIRTEIIRIGRDKTLRHIYVLLDHVGKKVISKEPSKVRKSYSTNGELIQEKPVEEKEELKTNVSKPKAEHKPKVEQPITNANNPFAFFADNIGVLTPHVAEQIEAFVEDFTDGEAIVIKALEITVENQKRNFGYAKSILNNWYAANVRTEQDLKSYLLQSRGGNNNAKGQQSASTNAGRYTGALPDSFNW